MRKSFQAQKSKGLHVKYQWNPHDLVVLLAAALITFLGAAFLLKRIEQ